MARKAAIIGGGVIGGGWAARFLLNGWDVGVFDPDPEAERKIAAVLSNARAALPASDLPGIAQALVDAFAREHHWFDDELAGGRLDEMAALCGVPLAPHQGRLWLALTRQLMGFPRHLSQHVGGFVLTQDRLDTTEVVLVQVGSTETRVTQALHLVDDHQSFQRTQRGVRLAQCSAEVGECGLGRLPFHQNHRRGRRPQRGRRGGGLAARRDADAAFVDEALLPERVEPQLLPEPAARPAITETARLAYAHGGELDLDDIVSRRSRALAIREEPALQPPAMIIAIKQAAISTPPVAPNK